MTILYVIKRDGSKESFSPGKLNKWAQYATKTGGDWSEIALETAKRLPETCSSEDIHKTMIKVCLDKEHIAYSRIAARLELATIRKNIEYVLNIPYNMSFTQLFNEFVDSGIWDGDVLPEVNDEWNDWYEELCNIKLEYWQLKQWNDKYSLKIDDLPIETPAMGVLALSLAIHGDSEKAYSLAKGVVSGKINLPTPVINGCRNGDFNTISCCVIAGGDTVDSIGVAEHIAYKMTAKKAGIGITFQTRSKGDPVKGGAVKHLGKHGIYQTVDRSVKMFTQVSRGGSATMTYAVHDPEIEKLLLLKTQRVDIEERIDKIDYSLAYNDAFLHAVIHDEDWALWSLYFAPSKLHRAFYHEDVIGYNGVLTDCISEGLKVKWVKARDLLKIFLTSRQETGRIFCINVTRTNEHTPFLDTIYQSNLCQEIALPTKPYEDMFDLYNTQYSIGETAFCSLSAINVSKVSEDEYEDIAKLTLQTVDILIDNAPMMTPSMEHSVRRRRSVGIGITGLAGYLYKRGLDYDGSDESLLTVSRLAEMHYYYLLKASQEMVVSGNGVGGVDLNWLPIDTMHSNYIPEKYWEDLRGKPRKHSVLVAHMPTESSAVFSDATNGLYPVRSRIINKQSRKGSVQYIAPEGDYMLAWATDNNILARVYSRVQDFTDQTISADYYADFNRYPDGKVGMSQLIKEWVVQAKLGNKTMYYVNTNDSNGGSFQDVAIQDDSCCRL